MFQEPVIAIVLKSSDKGLRLCVRSGQYGAASSIIAEAGGTLEGDPLANFRVEPGYQIQATWKKSDMGYSIIPGYTTFIMLYSILFSILIGISTCCPHAFIVMVSCSGMRWHGGVPGGSGPLWLCPWSATRGLDACFVDLAVVRWRLSAAAAPKGTVEPRAGEQKNRKRGKGNWKECQCRFDVYLIVVKWVQYIAYCTYGYVRSDTIDYCRMGTKDNLKVWTCFAIWTSWVSFPTKDAPNPFLYPNAAWSSVRLVVAVFVADVNFTAASLTCRHSKHSR